MKFMVSVFNRMSFFRSCLVFISPQVLPSLFLHMANDLSPHCPHSICVLVFILHPHTLHGPVFGSSLHSHPALFSVHLLIRTLTSVDSGTISNAKEARRRSAAKCNLNSLHLAVPTTFIPCFAKFQIKFIT